MFPASEDSHRVFKADSKTPPEPLSLGRWMSISGAAFSAAAGANTTVPLAILCGMFNVRLGYWWNSGTGYGDRWMERLFPVQSALCAEMFARTHGTAGQLWNISDGGHFENMGGYELIRRRLPVIVIVDAEADPDYSFQGFRISFGRPGSISARRSSFSARSNSTGPDRIERQALAARRCPPVCAPTSATSMRCAAANGRRRNSPTTTANPTTASRSKWSARVHRRPTRRWHA